MNYKAREVRNVKGKSKESREKVKLMKRSFMSRCFFLLNVWYMEKMSFRLNHKAREVVNIKESTGKQFNVVWIINLDRLEILKKVERK